jgi:hypothetical protein
MKLINYQPIIQNRYARRGVKPTRRASFDEHEFTKLQEYMHLWVDGKGKTDRRVNSSHIYSRKLLQIYVHFLAYTCSIPDDHIDPRRWALFAARWVLGDSRKEKRHARTTA